jgi:hypothetical protein
MSNIGLIKSVGMKNFFRAKIVIALLVSIGLICVVGVAIIMCFLLIKPEVKAAVPDVKLLQEYLGLTLYASSLISIGVTLNSTLFQTMVKEKTRGNITALLATPLKATDVWVGKSLSIFLPGMVFSILMTVLTLVIVNVIFFLPDIGFICNWQMLVNSLVGIPLIYLFFGLLAHLVGFIARPATGNVIAQVFLPVLANIVIQLAVHHVMGANSWQFLAMNFGIAIVIGAIVLALRRQLITEKIILSV